MFAAIVKVYRNEMTLTEFWQPLSCEDINEGRVQMFPMR